MKHSRGLGILCFAFLLSSCAPIQPGPQDTQALPERIVRQGFSFKPPDEKGWLLPTSGRISDVALIRRGDDPDESSVIRASLSKAPELAVGIALSKSMAASGYDTSTFITKGLAEIVRETTKSADPLRYKGIKVEIVPHLKKDSDCVKRQLTYEDNAPVRSSGKKDPMLFESLALFCTHPNDKIVLVMVEYSHRYILGQSDPRFLEKAMNVLNSIEFAAL